MKRNNYIKIIGASQHNLKNINLEIQKNKFVNINKLLIFYQSAKKGNLSLIRKKIKCITFVGKLNRAKV